MDFATVKRGEVLRYMGCKGDVPPEVLNLAEECLAMLGEVCEPRYVVREFPLKMPGDGVIETDCFRTVSRNLEKITIRTDLINMHDSESGMGSVTAGFRYHILPLCLGKGGSLEMKSGGQSCKFRRTQERMIFARGATESAMAMKKLFEAPRAPVMIDDNILTWRMPETEMKVRMSVEPAGAFAGFACWDTPNLETPTFEPFFLPVTLKAGESAGYTLTLTAGK